mmetsp:Transcript_25823/g.42328  ORF Transcript_25823/g.42328 Transcript_25823/m.42328 type:complete len:170 (-) Transcript_25823:1041-1550(-)|eukprot:CAMPEP_0201884054 /NCGR_PEP_ID=MMETSP0902-20130614/16400_1 /ASSEMBLY_ACC=CAM_ASM_000551 /TAXON_ID=420261 /ORGANISM="Thalassiosira antarctica, Strain CCMP982" /LENGTH=169 /DNA_ID=CAMNT_0048412941 /DNA_START=55 /DNA_END=564 /DNA_ORIENTATION=+
MKIISITSLVAAAMSASVSSGWEEAHPYRYVSILKAHEDARVMLSNAIVNEIIANHTASFIEDPSETYECEAQTDLLSKCLDDNMEPDAEHCWSCVMPSENPASCTGFLADVETCRIHTCHSGAACKSEYYTVLNCVMSTMEGTHGCAFVEANNAPANKPSAFKAQLRS